MGHPCERGGFESNGLVALKSDSVSQATAAVHLRGAVRVKGNVAAESR